MKIIKNYGFENLHVGLTSICNATCWLCPRTYDLEVAKTQIRLNQFIELLPKATKKISFSGVFGDPILCKDFLKIIKYTKSLGVKLNIETNGGVHSTNWWKELALMLDSNDRIKFGFDGLEDTNHIYRRGVNWKTAFSNAESFINSGGKAIWKFIAFEHNQHQIEEAKKLAELTGFVSFELKSNNGADASTPIKSSKILENPLIGHNQKQNSVRCKAIEKKELYVDQQGKFHPCCWIAEVRERMQRSKQNCENQLDHWKKTSLVSNQEDFLTSDYWIGIQHSWTKSSVDQGLFQTCSNKCGTLNQQTLTKKININNGEKNADN